MENATIQIRHFSPDLKTEIPGNHTRLYAVPIQLDVTSVPVERRAELAQRTNGLPILLNRSMSVVAMYVEPHGQMDEHGADVPILFIVTRGKGFVRVAVLTVRQGK